MDGISNFRLAGVSLYGKTDLNVTDATDVLTYFARGELPASFVLNVVVQNADTGAGDPATSTATLTSLSWTMLIDDIPTIDGDIPQPILIPGAGREAIVPIWMKLDLRRFFKDQEYDKLVSLAFALGGAHGSASRVMLRAQPTLKTESGILTYPGEIEIVVKKEL